MKTLDDIIDLIDKETKLSKIRSELKYDKQFGNTESERHAYCSGKLAGALDTANKIRIVIAEFVRSE